AYRHTHLLSLREPAMHGTDGRVGQGKQATARHHAGDHRLEAALMSEPHTIHPTSVYSVDEAQAILRLKDSSIRREVREGRLKVAKRCGRYYLLGKWIIEWLETGQLKRDQREPANGVASATG